MSEIKFRNRFKFQTVLSSEEVREKLKTKLTVNNPNQFYITKTTSNHQVLKFPRKIQQIWTPQMDITFEIENEKNIIKCLIGPAPIVWTFFMFLFGTFCVIALFGSTFWLTNYMLNKETWVYIPTLISLVCIIIIASSVKIVQYYTKPEMNKLKTYLDEALDCDCFKLAIEE
jgi:hypothetical protein